MNRLYARNPVPPQARNALAAILICPYEGRAPFLLSPVAGRSG